MTQTLKNERVSVEKNFPGGYVLVMSDKNAPHIPKFVTSETYESIAEQLREWAERLAKVDKKIKNRNETGLYQFNWNTVEFAMKRIASAVTSAEESQLRSGMGNPIKEGERKPRSRDKADGIITAQRNKHYGLVAENPLNQQKKPSTKKKG